MKIYLSVPLQINRNKQLAKSIGRIIESLDCQLVSKWVTIENPNGSKSPFEIYKRDCDAISSSNIVLADISTPSIGVGMEIMLADTLKKKIICIYNKNPISNMVRGMPGISLLHYSDINDLTKNLESAIKLFRNENIELINEDL